ncbi:GGDEF domain-containing protein [Vibrio mexicanus]|uniref:GGDEF domain-containing protein n=1 Tax=Vibrio mexicanus TaxID=1004326 RepID=UPI00063CA173|nr:GGDEF domain-containing protein [Vibrio mexicanus]
MSTSLVTSNWFRVFFPLLLLAMLWLGMTNVISITQANLGFVSNLPYILFTVVIGLSHTFRQSRIGMVSLAMLVAYWYIQTYLQTSLSEGTTLLELSLLAFLLPVACLIVYRIKDSSVNSRSFALYIVTLSLMFVWSYVMLTYIYEGGFDDIDDSFLFVLPSISRLPFILVMYLASLIGICSILIMVYNRIVDVVIYSSIILASTTFIFFHIPYISCTMFTLAGILLLLHLISASYELAFTDRLTGIPGRHSLESDIRHLGRRYCIAMLDIDHFKSFNDTYGHDTGDDVLKLVASKLTEVGGRAKVYRYGGEEFTVIFGSRHCEDAKEHLEDLRIAVEEYEMTIRNNESRPKNNKEGSKKRGKTKPKDVVNITISIGVASSRNYRTPHEVLKAADEALYKAKKGGRNRVAVD